MKKNKIKEITVYDKHDTSTMVDASRPINFKDIGLKLPDEPPTKVLSIRLPLKLLNELRAFGSERDIPYQTLIKLFISEALERRKKKAA